MHIKNILEGYDSHLKIIAGIDKAAHLITSTLGPQGRNVIIEQRTGPVRITKDGVTVAKSLEFEDAFENLGAQLIAQISHKTCEDAGDGTTTSALLAQYIYREGLKAIQIGMNPVNVKKGIDMAVKQVVEHIMEHAIPITNDEQLKQIATIASNGDEHIGGLLATAFSKIGEDGTITLTEAKHNDTTLEFVEGIVLDVGFDKSALSCINNRANETCEYHNCSLLFHDDSFKEKDKLMPLIEMAAKTQKPLVIMAEEFGNQICIPMINTNNVRAGTRICPVNLPYMDPENKRAGQWMRDYLEDFAVITGGKLIPREQGVIFSQTISEDYFGTAETVVVSRGRTTIIGGKGDPVEIEARKQTIIDEQKRLKNEVVRDELYEQHLIARLRNFNGMAVIRAGGATIVEIGERKDRIEDAMHATRAALAQGIVPGGGIALLKAKKLVENSKYADLIAMDDRYDAVWMGINIIRKAMVAPITKIIQNAGKDPAVIISKIREESRYEMGYDAKNDEIVDMIECGIIDPAKVVYSTIQNAASIAGLLLTTSGSITFKDRFEDAAPNFGNIKL